MSITDEQLKQVVTYQTPGGHALVNLCEPCILKLQRRKLWTHDRNGQEHCGVYQGRHKGQCDCCQSDRDLNIW
jgi:hypothetical protein